MASNSMAGFITGSHAHFSPDSDEHQAPTRQPSSKTCRVCGDEIGYKENGEVFVACHVCGFPVCRPCYEYERSEGNQSCPQCNTRYKRHKGCPRVAGDEEENLDADDFDDEFSIKNHREDLDRQHDANHVGNGDYNQEKLHPNGQAFSSAGSVTGKDFDGEKDFYSNAEWQERVEKWKVRQEKRGLLNKEDGKEEQGEDDDYILAEARQPLWRKVPISSSLINPYRIVIIMRLVILAFFFRFRILTPANDAYALWLISVICEIWFALSWILDQFPKWFPITQACGETCVFAPLQREYEEFKVKINSLVAKAQKKPEEGWVMQDGTPWPGNNTRDHPGMIQVYLGSAGALDVEGKELPRLVYISREKQPGYPHHKKAGAMNALVRVSAVLTNAPFMLNLDCDHYVNNSKAVREAMCFLMDPNLGKKLCYVQFPQRFDGIDRHDRYANRNTVFFDINMKGLDGIQGPVYVGTGTVFNRQALYGYDPPVSEKRPKMTCDCWPSWCCFCCGGSRKSKAKKKSGKGLFSVFSKNKSKKKMMGKDYVRKGSGSMFDLEEIEEGLEGYEDLEKSSLMSQKSFEKRFGQSPVFIASTLMENGGLPEGTNSNSLVKEAIHVISCGYEEKTEWGKEIGWIYGSITEDILTGFKMHCRGWKSVYCMPKRAAFKGSAPINLSDRLHQVLRWALGSVEIFLSRHCPLWYGYGGKLKYLERLAYTNTIVYPFTSIPLLAYCTIPAVCLLTGKFIIPTLTNLASVWFMALFISIILTSVLELRWSGVTIEALWRNEQFWVIGGVSAHLFAVFQGLLKVLAGVDTNFTVTSKAAEDAEFGELYLFKWTTLLIPPTTLIILNIVGVVAGVSGAINNGYGSWGPLFGKLFFAFWVIVHLYPFLKGLMGKQNRTPTIVVLWSILLASIFSLIWVRIDPFLPKQTGPVLKQCGVEC
ncbi:hypothetical protein ACSQ67_020227 [Phaseolus vulgaris]